LRRSSAVELCRQLVEAGARVVAFDPAIKKSSPELEGVALASVVEAALAQADAAVVCTEWPLFREINWSQAVAQMRRALIVDANRFLEKPLQDVSGVEHISVGRV
jgi:UDPglucose 6-dehydrogenase